MNINSQTAKNHLLWADTAAGALRAAFGLIWAIDAYLKWQPAFFNNYLSYITDVVSGQPRWLLPWFNFWVGLVQLNPSFFARATQLIETAIAIGLLFGLGRKWLYVLGGVFALIVWSVPEGFGGPYTPGATDVDSGILYFLVFCTLIVVDYVLGRSPYSVDFYLEKQFPAWRKVVELAPEYVVDQEPRYLSWNIQIVAILGMVIALVVILTIITSEINAPATQSSLPSLNQMVFLQHIPLRMTSI